MKTIGHILTIAAMSALCCTTAKAQTAVSFSATPENACTGETVAISVTTPKSEYKLARVNFADGTDTYGDDLKHIFAQAGTYNITVTLLLNDNQWSSPATQTVTVGEAPTLTLEDHAAAALLTATAPGASFEWTRNDEKLATTESSLYYLESGTYTVTATNSNGCSASETIRVKYEPQTENDDTEIRVVNNVITPSVKDGNNDVLFIDDVDNFPSPCSVQIFDKKGKLVYTNTRYTNTNGFQGLDDDGNMLFAGTYYYVIKSQGKKGCTGFVDIIR